tara:strand:+ start:13119 stop:13394 length:276 start_codon:yes stop_codon:yes gene_type:complete
MNNTEKKLDALIDALGFDVESVDSDVFKGVYSGREVYNKEVISYKLTKRNLDDLFRLLPKAIESVLMIKNVTPVEVELILKMVGLYDEEIK